LCIVPNWGKTLNLKALQDAAVQAKVYAARGKNHTTLNSDLGLPGDEATKELFEFLGSR
jgi:hypothetical protein